jgi:hypothetical protein
MQLIIDGDVLAYQACEARWKEKVNNDVSVKRLDENGKPIQLEFTVEEDRKYLEKSWENFKSRLQGLCEAFFCENFLMAVGGKDNFRNMIMPSYKQNRHRDPTKANKFVPVIRQLAVIEDLAVAADGREADDLLRIWAEEARAIEEEYIICSIDKDLKCIPGNHWNMKYNERFFVSEAEALKHYYCQLLKGDPTDNILGVPKIGEVKAARILASLNKEEEYQEAVVGAYIGAYDDQWYEQLVINGRMIYLQKHYNDYFDPRDWPVVKELRGKIKWRADE